MTYASKGAVAQRERDCVAKAVELAQKALLGGMFGSARDIGATAAGYYRGLSHICAATAGVDPATLIASPDPADESLRRWQLDKALRAAQAGDVDMCTAEVRVYTSGRRDSPQQELFLAGGPALAEDWGRPGASRGALERLSAATLQGGKPVPMTHVAHDDRIAELVADASMVARRAVPLLAGDAFSCCARVGVFATDVVLSSSYSTSAPLYVFVNERALTDPISAAEFLMHESLHQKLNDISLARALVRSNYDDAASDTVEVPWSFGSDRVRYFSADRSFAAFHVYTHQTVLYLGLYVNGLMPDDEALSQAALAWARADVFARGFESGSLDRELGVDGKELARWLATIAEQLGALRLPNGRLLREDRGRVHL